MNSHTASPVQVTIDGLSSTGLPAHVAKATRLALDASTYTRARDCVQCGLCLPACPTYTETRHEGNSPRGRINLIKGLADGTVTLSDPVRRHLETCLDCRACETACPSGVVYHELIEEARARLHLRPRRLDQRLVIWLSKRILAHATRLNIVLWPLRLLERLGGLALLRNEAVLRRLPQAAVNMLNLLPSPLPRRVKLTAPTPRANAIGRPPRVALLTGCVADVLESRLHQQTLDLLAHAGFEPTVPRGQVCCGAIHHHAGAPTKAWQWARQNIDVMLPGDDPDDWPEHIITNVAGCGAMLADYGWLLHNDPDYADKARAFARRSIDIHKLLATREFVMPYRQAMVAAYHDACHLAHGQGVTDAPRQLLGRVKGLDLRPLAESLTCCGAAGTYNLVEPDMAGRLATRKLDHVTASGAMVCISANIGCTLHLQASARRQNLPIRIVHPIEVLHDAAFGPMATPD